MYDGDDDDDMYGRVDDDMYGGDGDNNDNSDIYDLCFFIILMRLATMMISFHNHTYYIHFRIMERTK